jgi:hypothetical protein
MQLLEAQTFSFPEGFDSKQFSNNYKVAEFEFYSPGEVVISRDNPGPITNKAVKFFVSFINALDSTKDNEAAKAFFESWQPKI